MMYCRDDRSYCATAGCLARARTIGGATYRPVMRWFWMAARKVSRSKRGRTTTVAPSRRGAFMRAVRP